MGFKFKVQYAGTCKAHPEHTWKAGDLVCYDKENKKMCINEECYKEQGGSPIEASKGGQGRKRLSLEEARSVSKKAWCYALDDASEIFKDDKTTLLQVAKLLYSGMIELMK